jgi:DNA (cytosine-5)-methyltransferase 1
VAALRRHVGTWRPGDATWAGPPSVWLVTEPLRWALGVRPDWVACEQVPEVLPIWHVVAERLRAEGYSAWAGVLNAADYGVPQTRQRAVLMASRSRPAVPPAATHARRPRVRLDGTELPSWATMAEALERRGLRSAPLPRWCHERPATTVQGDRRIGRPGHKDWVGGERQFDRDAVTLAPDELAALQDFPPGYCFAGTSRSVACQIGNAVPVGLAAAVVHALTSTRPAASPGLDALR